MKYNKRQIGAKFFGIKMMRFKTLIIPVFSLIFVILVSPAKAASDTIIRVEPYQSFAEVGETFSVKVTLNNVENLYGLEVEVFWNASILEVVTITPKLGRELYIDGVLHEIQGTAPIQIYQNKTTQELGKCILAASSIAPAPSFNGSGTIMQITFSVIGTKTCDISLAAKLYDKPPLGEYSNPISHTYQDGIFSQTSDYSLLIYTVTAIILIAVITGSIMYYKRARL